MELLERDDVLTALWERLTQATHGRGRLVLLRGEAGAGKTAVLDRFVERARSVADVLLGACDPLSTPRPLGPVVDIAHGFDQTTREKLDRALDGTAGVAGVFRTVIAALATSRPKLLVFEDVHWADEATLDLMCLLGRRIEDRPAMLVASYRDDEIGPTHRLRMLLGGLAGVSAVDRHTVGPLSQNAVAQLAAGRHRDVSELHRITGGNPFFVTEVLADNGDGIPATVTEAVAGRLSKVSANARRAAEAVATIGSPAPVTLVTPLVENAEDAIEELLHAGLLTATRNAVGFRHELARMAVIDTIPDFRRTALHTSVLDLLRADPATREDSALLAHHAELAGDSEAVLTHAPVAAKHAATLGAHREAAAHYSRVLRFGGSLPPRDRAALLEHLAREHTMSSQLTEAITTTRAALELRQQLNDRLRQGDNLRWLSFILWPSGHCGEAELACRKAVDILEALPPSPELAWAHATMCQFAAYDQTGVARAEHHAERAVALGRRFNQPEIVEQALFHLAATRYFCAEPSRNGDGWADMDHARARALAAGLVEPAAFMAMGMGQFGTLHRDHGRAFAALDLVEECALDNDITAYLLFSRGIRAYGLMNLGRWTEAADLAASVLSHPTPPMARILALTTSALISARRGDPHVWPLLDEALNLVTPADSVFGPPRAARIEAAWLAGDTERAHAEAQHGLAATTPHTSPWATGELARWLRITGGDPPPTVRTTDVHALDDVSVDLDLERALVVVEVHLGGLVDVPFESRLLLELLLLDRVSAKLVFEAALGVGHGRAELLFSHQLVAAGAGVDRGGFVAGDAAAKPGEVVVVGLDGVLPIV
jgi:hypothetical protein